MVFTLILAFLYLRYTKPVYGISSTLLIKDEKKGTASDDMLSQLELFGGSKVVDNEIEILQSKTLMRSVVKRLFLDVNLSAEGRVVSTDIYSDRPVNFQTFEIQKKYFGKEFILSFPNSNQYALENAETGKK
ncbi:Wzz/FepE/Etk N-terminal domain-containing protein [Pedobacter panaciterrae]